MQRPLPPTKMPDLSVQPIVTSNPNRRQAMVLLITGCVPFFISMIIVNLETPARPVLTALLLATLEFLALALVLSAIAALVPTATRATTALIVPLEVDRCIDLLAHELGAEAVRPSEHRLTLQIESGDNLYNLGLRTVAEFVEVSVEAVASGTKIEIVSRSASPRIVADFGRNHRNVTTMLARLGEALSRVINTERHGDLVVSQRHRLANERLQQLEARSELPLLRETLSAVRPLIAQAPAQATAMLDSLTAFLRTAARLHGSNESTVGDELDLVRNYLELVAFRSRGQLTLALGVAPELEQIRCEPRLLLPMVEVALPLRLEPAPRTLQVQAALDQTHVRVQIAAVGPPVPNLNDASVALRPFSERLRARYGTGFDLRVSNEVDTQRYELAVPRSLA